MPSTFHPPHNETLSVVAMSVCNPDIDAFMLIGFASPKFVAFSFMVPNLSLKSFALPFSVF